MKKFLTLLFVSLVGAAFYDGTAAASSLFGNDSYATLHGLSHADHARTVSFTGKIRGNKQYFFNMELSFYNNQTVYGSYIVINGADRNVTLKGLYDERSESIVLYEYGDNGRKTGYYFVGSLSIIYSEVTYRCVGYVLNGHYKKDGTKVNWPFKAESYQFS